MFTGLIEQQGVVIKKLAGDLAHRVWIRVHFDDLKVGESIAVNGVCLTLLPHEPHEIVFDVSPETLSLTNLGQLQVNDPVNLERAMLASARFGGHYVNGHVDRTAHIQQLRRIDEYLEMHIGGFDACDILHLLPKGSIALDGVSLTLNEVSEGSIRVLLVPHTLAHTTLGRRQIGDQVNVEFDYLTRIVAHQVRMASVCCDPKVKL